MTEMHTSVVHKAIDFCKGVSPKYQGTVYIYQSILVWQFLSVISVAVDCNHV